MSLKSILSAFATVLKVLATVAGLLGAVSAHATLIGDEVKGTLTELGFTSVTAGFRTSPPAIVVDSGVEFTGEITDSDLMVLLVGANLSDSQIVITAALGTGSSVWGVFEGDGFSVLLEDLDWVGQAEGSIMNVKFDVDGSEPGPWSISDPRFGSDFVELSFFVTSSGGAAKDSNNFAFQIDVEHTPVPEPTTLALLALGLAGLGFRRRQIH